MSKKFVEASDDVKKLVETVVDETCPTLLTIPVHFKVLSVQKAKEIVSVQKANDVVQFFSNKEDLVLVYVWEDLFFQFPEEDRKILVENALAGVFYKYESSNLSVQQPTIKTHPVMVSKYNMQVVNILETAFHLIDKTLQDEKGTKKSRKRK